MSKHLFISKKNRWFYRLAILTSLLALSFIVVETNAIEWRIPYQHSMEIAILSLIGLLSVGACLLHQALRLKPLMICVGVIGLAASEYFLDSWLLRLQMTQYGTDIHLFILISILCLLWWLSAITRPHSYSVAKTDYKKFRFWTWLGLIAIFSQILIGGGSMSNLLTTTYLSLFSLILIFNRQLFANGLAILFIVSSEMILVILNYLWGKALWLTVSQTTLLLCLLLTLISLLIHLYRKPRDFW